MTETQQHPIHDNPHRPWRISARSWAVLAVAAAVLAVVTLFPQIDLSISTAFYSPGEGFPWRTSLTGTFVRHEVPPLILASLVICVLVWLFGLARRRRFLGLTTRKIVYLVTTMIVGPGLFVESLLKPYSGRARPQDLSLFGGTAVYTPPLAPAHACASNCSFVSGHAAIAFWLTAYAFVVPRPWRGVWLAFGFLIGGLVGAMRVMQGAHFPSDVAYAGAVVIAVNIILARLILTPETLPSGAPARD